MFQAYWGRILALRFDDGYLRHFDLFPMKCTCLIACIILATQVVGQRPDSLWQVYNETDKPVEDRLEAIHKLGRHFMYQNPDTSIYYAKAGVCVG